MHNPDFTEGKIIGPLLRFVFPIMFALFLQSLYGAVDLLIVVIACTGDAAFIRRRKRFGA